MPTHAEKRILPFSPRQLYDVVADIQHYPDFLPWVTTTKVSKHHKDKDGEHFLADVTIGYKIFTYPYKCRVHLTPHHRIDIEYIEGPFTYLNNHWIFTPLNEKLTEIDFFIDFEFHTPALQTFLQPVFTQVVSHMISAFEKRAFEIY